MSNTRTTALVVVLVLTVLFMIGATAWAQTSASFDLNRNVIAGGSGTSASSSYLVEGTIGQSEAGSPFATSGSYAVSSGFWMPAPYWQYMPVVRR